MSTIKDTLEVLLEEIKQMESLGLTNTIQYNKISEEYQCLAMSIIEEDIFDDDSVQ